MKTKFVKDLEKHDQLSEEQFVLISYKKNLTKSGDEYYRIELGDKTGIIGGNIWSDNIRNCEPDAIEEGKIVKVYGKIEEYKDAKQVNVISLGIAKEYSLNDFVATSKRDLEEMWKEFNGFLEEITSSDIKALLENLFSNEELQKKFKTHPAGEKVHHAFQGGLIEHILEMLDLAKIILKHYPEANKDIVYAGIVFHDIGKINEIDNLGIRFERTLKGNLLGHIIQSYEILLANIPDNFPENLLVRLKHVILSHHGILEYGSPVLPMTIEASIVSEVDMTSSRVRQYQKIMQENAESQKDFSERDFYLGTKVYLKQTD